MIVTVWDENDFSSLPNQVNYLAPLVAFGGMQRLGQAAMRHS